ncbi:MAG: helix-turn-helix domain-containing protein [Prosthecobacter sp.]|nr:helix-turn-helix domain-containing protein [Prosthecobacter sp.]
MSFGRHIREARERLNAEDRAFSLRQVALRVGIEPAYLSKIERDVFQPPSEDVIVKLAAELKEDEDILLAMAGKLSTELQNVILQRPKLFGELLRQLKSAPDHAILRIAREIRDGDW